MSILLLKREVPSGPGAVTAGLQVLSWLDEGSGQTVVDHSGAGRHGTLGSTTGADTNDPSWSAAGLQFAVDDWVSHGSAAELRSDAWTISVAAKVTPGVAVPLVGWGSVAQFPAVYAAAPFNQNRPLIWLASTCFRYFDKASPSNLQDGGWHFFVFSCPGNAAADILQSELVVDGLSHAATSTDNSTAGQSKTICRLGAAGTTYFANAEVAFFSVHNRVLSGAEKEAMRTYAKAVLTGRVTLP
ncbi:MAG: hypothetical protein GC160_19520 [Acidobacteria bacterium]|nr:hypothetical protein [Acidobacteriota bacterium]